MFEMFLKQAAPKTTEIIAQRKLRTWTNLEEEQEFQVQMAEPALQHGQRIEALRMELIEITLLDTIVQVEAVQVTSDPQVHLGIVQGLCGLPILDEVVLDQ